VYFNDKLAYKCNEDSRLGMNARNVLNTCEFTGNTNITGGVQVSNSLYFR
jgi:hypothetical protein